jgi:hypothetical protein
MLPENALLEIFHFYKDSNHIILTWTWKTLTQVCRRWRDVVFGSPRRLDLQLLCTSTTPDNKLLDVWPPLPIIVYQSSPFPDLVDVENLIAALECHDRVFVIFITNIRDLHHQYPWSWARKFGPCAAQTISDFETLLTVVN